jgi:uncharacterized protein YjiS (DUF1127 family)
VSVVGVLQDCLEAEHAALYGYGVLGGRLAAVAAGSSWRKLADAAYAEHRLRRDELAELLVRNDAVPVASEPAYATPFDVMTLADCQRLARLIEARCSAVYADAVSRSRSELRELVAHALSDCAVRETSWGQAVRAFPGAAEL